MTDESPVAELTAPPARELHRLTVAHAESRSDISRQLSELGRRFIELAHIRCARNEERIARSMNRVERLPGWRTATRARVRAAFK